MAEDKKDEERNRPVASRPSIMLEFWFFLKENKKWWLLPILIVLALLGALILVGGSPAGGLIYTLF